MYGKKTVSTKSWFRPGCEMRTCSISVHFLGLIVVERKMELERCGEGIVISMKDPFDR